MTKRKLYAIGDIHGCSLALIRMMKLIEEDRAGSPAKIVFLGDYIDRGPDSPGVVQHLIDLKNSTKTPEVEYVFLKGNHEDLLLGALDGKPQYESTFLYNGGSQTLNQYNQEATMNLGQHRAHFFEDLELMHRDGDFVFVHAGLDPHSPLANQDEEIMIWDRGFVKYTGVYHENVFVVHGHTPVENPTIFGNQMNIDTGCVFGKEYSEDYGKLTAVRLDDRAKCPGLEGFKFFHTREFDLIEGAF